jgi:hypothetical protein
MFGRVDFTSRPEPPMPTPKLPNATYVERVLTAIESRPFASLVIVVLTVCGTLAACLHK